MTSRKGISLKLKFAVLLTVVVFLPSILLVSGEDFQINSYLGLKPTIDGVIDSNEELAIGKLEKIELQVDPWFMGGDQEPRIVEFGSCHTNDSYLYIITTVSYTKEILKGNITYLLRKKDSNDLFDIKRVTSVANYSLYGFVKFHGGFCFDDSSYICKIHFFV